jgi:hypothetical protein
MSDTQSEADRILAHIIKTNGWYAGCQTFKDYAKSLEATITTQRAEMAHTFRVLRDKLWDSEASLKSFVTDQCDTEEYIRTVSKRFIKPEIVDGDSNYVPSIEDLVDMLGEKLSESEATRVKMGEAAEKAEEKLKQLKDFYGENYGASKAGWREREMIEAFEALLHHALSAFTTPAQAEEDTK